MLEKELRGKIFGWRRKERRKRRRYSPVNRAKDCGGWGWDEMMKKKGVWNRCGAEGIFS